MGQFQPNLAQNILGLREVKFVQIKDHFRFQGERITKYWKYIDEILKYSSQKPVGRFKWYMTQSIQGEGD